MYQSWGESKSIKRLDSARFPRLHMKPWKLSLSPFKLQHAIDDFQSLVHLPFILTLPPGDLEHSLRLHSGLSKPTSLSQAQLSWIQLKSHIQKIRYSTQGWTYVSCAMCLAGRLHGVKCTCFFCSVSTFILEALKTLCLVNFPFELRSSVRRSLWTGSTNLPGYLKNDRDCSKFISHLVSWWFSTLVKMLVILKLISTLETVSSRFWSTSILGSGWWQDVWWICRHIV